MAATTSMQTGSCIWKVPCLMAILMHAGLMCGFWATFSKSKFHLYSFFQERELMFKIQYGVAMKSRNPSKSLIRLSSFLLSLASDECM